MRFSPYSMFLIHYNYCLFFFLIYETVLSVTSERLSKFVLQTWSPTMTSIICGLNTMSGLILILKIPVSWAAPMSIPHLVVWYFSVMPIKYLFSIYLADHNAFLPMSLSLLPVQTSLSILPFFHLSKSPPLPHPRSKTVILRFFLCLTFLKIPLKERNNYNKCSSPFLLKYKLLPLIIY